MLSVMIKAPTVQPFKGRKDKLPQVVSKELREERAAEMAAGMGDWGSNVFGFRAHLGLSGIMV